MQEFLHLLGLYFFIRGFIMNSGMRDRYLTVLAFLAAVLSQEITALQILPLTVCYMLFGQRRSWTDEIRLLVAAGCALALIGLDYAFFKIDCLTALEGVSPRIEARIGWWFDKSANFLALLIGYSRMHIVLSAFLIPGFWIACAAENALDFTLPLFLLKYPGHQLAYYEQGVSLRILPYPCLDTFVHSLYRRVHKVSGSGMVPISHTDGAGGRMDGRYSLLLEPLAYS